MEFEEEQFWNNVMTVVCMRGYNWGGTKSFNFPSNQNAMNIDYIGDVTLENSCFDNIASFSFGIADCGKLRGAGSGRYKSFRPIYTVAPLSSGCTSKSGKINMMKYYSKHHELKNLLMANYCFKSLSLCS